MKTPDTTDGLLEQRLRAWYRAEVGQDESVPLTLRRDVVVIPRGSVRRAGLFGRGRGVMLFAAAALLLVGGAAAASGLLRLPSLVPQVALVTFAPLPSPSVFPTNAVPTAGTSPAPSGTAVHPGSAVFVFNQGTGTAAECGNDGLGGCISRLWVANLDGSGPHELLPGQTGCQRFQAWSPDGTQLLFSRSDCRWGEVVGMTGLDRFYLTDAGGSEPRLVDTSCVSPCLSEGDAVFSPDGQQILFLRTKSIPPPPLATDPVTGKPAQATGLRVLASMDLATGRVTELGNFDECDQCGTQWPRSYPRWSPDRTQIVFTWETPTPEPQPPADPPVFVADADGRNVLQLSLAGYDPSWSPDGTRIVFRGGRYERVAQFEYRFFSDIYTIRPDGTDLRRLTTDQISSSPRWSVDGRMWFIRAPRVEGNPGAEGPPQFWIMDADGGNPEQLSSRPPFETWQIQPTP